MRTPALRFAASLATGLALALPVAPAQPSPSPRPPLRSQVFEWSKLAPRVTPNGERRDVANHPTPTLAVFESHITTLNPGRSSHAPHRHPQEELIIVKEGTLEATIPGEVHRAGAGSILLFTSNDLHGMRNAGDAPLTYYVIRMITAATPKA
jgi:quercetin dioxygenase-like cupin family protein